ncbi:MAG: hypothetical protein EOP86_23005 [Verrucomicrobiaceae bacterium]|nr:MAG: hypothetical protein EOP86_23005 [Verrucomicrobiaceae bacterium]
MKNLERYLNDHISGSAAALSLLETLAETDAADAEFHLGLRREIDQNRAILLKLIESAGFHRRHWQERMAAAASAAGQLRLRWQGLSPGHSGLLEALEVLELGIHGQLLLWRCLKDTAPALGLWADTDFESLITSAESQKNRVEARRMIAAKRAFNPGSHAA